MTRIILSAALAAALALAPAASPARADEGPEILSLLLGIGLVHAIGKGIERARSPVAVSRPAAMPAPPPPGPCADVLFGESRGLGGACFARRQGAASVEEGWHGAAHWYGADRFRP